MPHFVDRQCLRISTSAKSQGVGDSVSMHFVSKKSLDLCISRLANSYDSRLHFTLNQDTIRGALGKPSNIEGVP
jgi:hypothetical protein